eukprot:scaffold681_cov153-Isochrysis_galbana.AAC.4
MRKQYLQKNRAPAAGGAMRQIQIHRNTAAASQPKLRIAPLSLLLCPHPPPTPAAISRQGGKARHPFRRTRAHDDASRNTHTHVHMHMHTCTHTSSPHSQTAVA